MADINKWANWIIQRCSHEQRYLVSFSEHDLAMLREYTSAGDAASELFRNGLTYAAKAYRREHGHPLPRPRTLEKLVAAAGVRERPGHHVDGKVPERLRAVSRGLAGAANDFDRMTKRLQREWDALLSYNYWDCKELFALCQHAVPHFALKPTCGDI